MNRRKKVVAVVLVVSSLFGGVLQTAASFSAQTRNPGNLLSSGTMVLVNTKAGSTACASTAGGSTDTNVNNSCDQLLNLTVRKPGDTATARLSLKNDGTIAGSALQLYEAACASSDAAGETYHGTGDMCASVQVYVQRYTDATYTTKSLCAYGGGTASTCDFSDTTKTLSAFATAYTSSAPLGLGALAAGSLGYYEIGVSLPSTANNSMQGRTATFDLTWLLQQ